jgi:hypothetical protein
LVQIQNYPLIAFRHQIANDLAEYNVAFANRDPPFDIQDRNPIDLTSSGLHFNASAILHPDTEAIEYAARHACYFMPSRPHENKRAPVFQKLSENDRVFVVGPFGIAGVF